MWLRYCTGLNEDRYIRDFKVTGCNDTLVNLIYAGILFNALPMLLFGAVAGCILAGGILWGIGYVFWKWISSFCNIKWNCRKNNTPTQPSVQIHSTPKPNSGNRRIQRSISHASLPPAYAIVITMDNPPPAYAPAMSYDNHKITNKVSEVIV